MSGLAHLSCLDKGAVDGFVYEAWSASQLARIEVALEQCLEVQAPARLLDAMRYAVLGGGKRLRPLLVLASAAAVGALQSEAAIRAACAVELIHAYSLVHDDMPCMDNDVLRRGLPTVHVKFGQAVAMLAGDALQTLAFEVLAPTHDECVPWRTQAQLAGLLARAAGASGMAGGQAIDLLNVGLMLDEGQLRQMHQCKTGALLSCCVAMGVSCADELVDDGAKGCLMTYAHSLGLAFQVVDDILDATADSTVIGKTAGKDANDGKPTYVSVLGLDVARQRVQDLYEQANAALLQSGLSHIEPLQALANRLVARSY